MEKENSRSNNTEKKKYVELVRELADFVKLLSIFLLNIYMVLPSEILSSKRLVSYILG